MENLNNLTKEENYYYNILEDMLFNGDIDESERNILNKRKEEFKISDSRAKELEDFAKLNNSNSRAKELKELEDLIKLNNGGSSYKNNKNSENKEENNEVLGITSSISERKAPHFKIEGEKDYKELKELEDIIKFDNGGSSYKNNKNSENKEENNEVLGITSSISERKAPQFETEGEKDYYELLVDMLEDGTIDGSERNILYKINGSERDILYKIKNKYRISDYRAKELEEFAKTQFSGKTFSIPESTPQFETEGEKDYYELLIDMRFDYNTSQRDMMYLNRQQYGISKQRAKELKSLAVKEIRKLQQSNTLQFKTEGEKYYYEFFVDILDKGYIPGSESKMLNNIKNEYRIFDRRAKELENFALEKLKPKNDSETRYYRLILNLNKSINGDIYESDREILVRRMKRYDIPEKRAKELEVFAKFYRKNVGKYPSIEQIRNNQQGILSKMKNQQDILSKMKNMIKSRHAIKKL